MTKQKIKKIVTYASWKAFGALIFVAVAGTSIWALAAFTEPTDTPSNSVQDWAKNIMGANNSDNAFDSSNVIANSNGSVVERLESLDVQAGATQISADMGATYHSSASTNCANLSTSADSSLDGSDINIVYTDWRLPRVEELLNFVNISSNTTILWSDSVAYHDGSYVHYETLRLSDGHTYVHYREGVETANYRCVR